MVQKYDFTALNIKRNIVCKYQAILYTKSLPQRKINKLEKIFTHSTQRSAQTVACVYNLVFTRKLEKESIKNLWWMEPCFFLILSSFTFIMFSTQTTSSKYIYIYINTTLYTMPWRRTFSLSDHITHWIHPVDSSLCYALSLSSCV